MNHAARRTGGMTLVEVLMAIAILITGLVAIFGLLNAGFQSHKRAINETEAAIVASSVMAETRGQLARGSVPPSDDKNTFNPSEDFPLYRVNRQVVSLEPARANAPQALTDREYFVRVEVRWSQQGENKSIVVQTIMFRNFNR